MLLINSFFFNQSENRPTIPTTAGARASERLSESRLFPYVVVYFPDFCQSFVGCNFGRGETFVVRFLLWDSGELVDSIRSTFTISTLPLLKLNRYKFLNTHLSISSFLEREKQSFQIIRFQDHIK